MRWLTRLIGCLTAVIVLIVGLNTFAGSWFGDEKGALHLGRWLLFETRRSEALRQRSEVVAQSWDIKHDLIGEVVAGRLFLRQAILQFKLANDLVEVGDRDMVATYYTPSDPESLGKQVMAWVRNEVAIWPPHKAERILTALDYEYQELFGRRCFEASRRSLEAQQSSGPLPAVVTD